MTQTLLLPGCTLFELPREASVVGGVHLDGVRFRRARDGKPIEMTIRFRSLYPVGLSHPRWLLLAKQIRWDN